MEAHRPGHHAIDYIEFAVTDLEEAKRLYQTAFELTRLIGAAPFAVHVARTFPLAEAAAAHRALEQHYLGKLVLRVA